jgi:hypothetical protein
MFSILQISLMQRRRSADYVAQAHTKTIRAGFPARRDISDRKSGD